MRPSGSPVVKTMIPIVLGVLAWSNAHAQQQDDASQYFCARGALAAGWALGGTSHAFNPQQDDAGNQKSDAEPLLYLDAVIGHAFPSTSRNTSVELKLILGNFGRLVNPRRLQLGDFNPDSSGVSVRRAMIADMTIRTPYIFGAGSGRDAAVHLALNAGFIFDAEADADSQKVLDAASYLFVGPTVVGRLSDKSRVLTDLLIGVSELLTGEEAFNHPLKDHTLRVRPRLRFSIGEGPFNKEHPLEIGFWGDLGTRKKDADAFTVFIATPLMHTP